MSEMDADLYEHIKRIAQRISCSDDADDLAHDAVVRVMEQAELVYDPKQGPFKPWASIVAANHIIDQLRREGKRADVNAQWGDGYARDSERMQRWLASDRSEAQPVVGKDAA